MRSASPLAPAELRGNRLWMRNYTISLRSWYNIAKQKWIPQIMRMILRWNDMDIKKVAVLGAGAVGSYVIWAFGPQGHRAWRGGRWPARRAPEEGWLCHQRQNLPPGGLDAAGGA